jgi:hypothetical protein
VFVKARIGGIVSPKGYSFISNSAEELKLGEIGVMAAVKRIHLDERIARAAQREGAVLVENSFVTVSNQKRDNQRSAKASFSSSKRMNLCL